MFRLSLIVVTLLPLIGMYRMENGGYGADIAEFGYVNGATVAYSGHVFVFWAAFVFVVAWPRIMATPLHRQVFKAERCEDRETRVSFTGVARAALLIQFGLCLLTFGPLGAYRVLFFDMGRGEFRTSFGSLGMIAMFQSQYLSPMLCALVAAVYAGKGCPHGRTLLVANCVLTAVNIGMWGYRAAAAINLLPTLVVLFPSIEFSRKMIRAGVLLLASVVVAQLIFGNADSSSGALELVWDRATTGSANSAWKIWDLHQAGHVFPPIWPTFWSMLPNRLNEALGIWMRSAVDFYQYSFSGIMTAVAQDYHRDLDASRSNVTGTPFCTGVIALGSPHYLIVSGISGCIAAATHLWVERARRHRDDVMLAAASTYSIISVWAFMNNGDPISLFSVASFVYYVAAAKFCSLLLASQSVTIRRRSLSAAPTAGLTASVKKASP